MEKKEILADIAFVAAILLATTVMYVVVTIVTTEIFNIL
jgi:hypothetical protein